MSFFKSFVTTDNALSKNAPYVDFTVFKVDCRALFQHVFRVSAGANQVFCVGIVENAMEFFKHFGLGFHVIGHKDNAVADVGRLHIEFFHADNRNRAVTRTFVRQ